MRADGNCSKCKDAPYCNEARTRMCAELQASVSQDNEEDVYGR